MRLRPEQLAKHLQGQLQPIYLVTGEETLLVQECCDQIRQQARQAGCTEREILDTSANGFKWDELFNSAASMSLFADRKLVELRIPNGKPGAEGSKALCEFTEMGSEDILLIVAGKIDKQSTNSKWFKALDGAGAIIQVWPVSARDLPRWLQQRVAASDMRIDDDALQLLCDRVEGNLLAASQEVEKLKLLADNGHISAQTVTQSVSDNARYNLFDMADQALLGNANASLRMLHGLRGEGTDATVVLWALAREIRTLYEVQSDCEQGKNVSQALQARRVWKSRVPLLQGALSRHNRRSLQLLLADTAQADGSIKGFAGGKPWDNLANLITALAGQRAIA